MIVDESVWIVWSLFFFIFFSLSFRCAGVCVSVSEVDGLWTMNKGSDSFFSLLFFYLDGAYYL